MIKIENVKKEFVKNVGKKEKQKFLAVNGISFDADGGEIVGILGPNGAGKTTLLRMIGGIMEPSSGSIKYDDLSFEDDEIAIKKQIAYLSGNTKIYGMLSPYELLKMCGEFYNVEASELEVRIKEIAQLLEMEAFLYNRIEKLSTGQVQRVNIARCLVHNPKYYIFDEVTSGLDILSRQIILEFIKNEKKNNKCVLYSTHYMEEAEDICDKIIMVNHGNVIYAGTPKDVMKQTKTNNLRDAFFKLIEGDENE